MIEESDFIRFCGQLVFQPDNNVWNTLPPEQQTGYCSLAQNSEWALLFIQSLKNSLPESFYPTFRERYQKETLKRLFEHEDLSGFYHLLESEKIPFIPVKGADLAFRIYPDQALRPHGDWDILFRKEDCPRVLKLLQAHGWDTFSGYKSKNPDHHHYERMHNKRQAIEVHWTLPNFGTAEPDDIWQETDAVNEYHRVLTPEMNLLLISAHSFSGKWTHMSVQKILMDAGYILKHDRVDWPKVHLLADRWGVLRPDILFSVWREFFPEGVLPVENPFPEQQKLIREIHEMRNMIMDYSAYERKIADHETHGIQWLMKKLRFYNGRSICLKYHLRSDQKGLILRYGLYDFFGKVHFFLTHSRRDNPELVKYYEKTKELEKLLKHEK